MSSWARWARQGRVWARGALWVLVALGGWGAGGPDAMAQDAASGAAARRAKPAASSSASNLGAVNGSPARRNAAAAAGASAVPEVSTAGAEQGFSLAPAPAWVEAVPVEPTPAGLPAAPVHVLLIDRQLRLTGQGATAVEQRFDRWVRQVNESAGLEAASRIEIEYDPSVQKLQWHTLALWRQGQRIDKLDAGKVKLLHREQQLERQMIDGRLTASLVLDDLRVGDRLEVAYSVLGGNPVFQGRFVDNDWAVSSNGPVGHYRYRLLAPPGRTLRHQLPEGSELTQRERGAERETLIQRRRVAQFRWDPYAPGIAMAQDMVQTSEFADWGEVATWAQGLFHRAIATAGPVVAERAAALKQRSADPAERLRLALDLVQTEVRYFGTEVGPYSHQPASVEKVLVQRFGDCKDKSALLVALLAALDIRATPVLVSTRFLGDVQRLLPSPLAFDHAIAAVQLEGRTLWLDATRSLQTGPAVERQPLWLGRALQARSGSAALDSLPSSLDVLRTETHDTFSVTDFGGTLRLESRLTFHGDLAENLRAQRNAMPADDFSRSMAGEYLRVYPNAEVDAPLRFEELPGHNALTVVQQFRLRDAWRFPEQRQLVSDFAFHAVMNTLRLPDQNPRQLALRLPFTGQYRQTVEYRFKEPVFARPGSSRFDDRNAHYELQVQQENTADLQRLQADLRVTADRVEAGDWSRYRDQLVKTWPRLSGTMAVSALSPAQFDHLRSRAARLEEDMRRGRVRSSTAVQREAQFKVLLLTEQLAAGRLTAPRLRAEALVARGMQLDHLGQLDDARADLEQALALDERNVEVRPALAVNALMRADDAAAVAQADAALRLAPSDNAPRYTRAYARYLQGDFAAARDELLQLLASRSEVERGYGPVWLYLAARRAGGDGLAAVQPFGSQASDPAWPHAVLRHFRGEITLDAARQAAHDRSTGKPDPSRLCELYFFLGQKALADGDRSQARDWFQRAVDTDVAEYVEHAMAKRELRRL